MRDVLRPASEAVQHVLERTEARLVGLRLLRRTDTVEGRPQLIDICHDLIVHGHREDVTLPRRCPRSTDREHPWISSPPKYANPS